MVVDVGGRKFVALENLRPLHVEIPEEPEAAPLDAFAERPAGPDEGLGHGVRPAILVDAHGGVDGAEEELELAGAAEEDEEAVGAEVEHGVRLEGVAGEVGHPGHVVPDGLAHVDLDGFATGSAFDSGGRDDPRRDGGHPINEGLGHFFRFLFFLPHLKGWRLRCRLGMRNRTSQLPFLVFFSFFFPTLVLGLSSRSWPWLWPWLWLSPPSLHQLFSLPFFLSSVEMISSLEEQVEKTKGTGGGVDYFFGS